MVAKKGRSISWSSFGAVAAIVLSLLASPTDAQSPQALHGLVQRLLPRAYHSIFDFQIVADLAPPTPDNKHDVFRVSNKDSGVASHSTRILIEGTTVSALSRGLKYYLDQAGEVELTWSGDRFNELPQTPPRVPDLEIDTGKTVTTGHVRGSFVPLRYYTNVVSFGYQYVWWDWKRWEREIDWMALNGINLIPAVIGQEYVFREFYRGFNLTEVEIDSFLTAPAYMPWQRMGNIQGSWNHQLLNSSATNELYYKNKWIDAQWDLQQLILARLKDLDINAILPTFQAFVPRQLPAKFPGHAFKQSSRWEKFPEEHTRVTYVVQTDPLFNQLSAQFLALQEKLNKGYKSRFYLLDLYNELVPDCMTDECLKATTSSVTKALQQADPHAVWVMQGWFLQDTTIWTPQAIKAYFQGILDAQGSPFILDLASESASTSFWDKTDGYYGADFGWNVLQNFGAAQGLFGKLPTILTSPFQAYNEHPTNLKGVGVTAESINNNEYVYQTLFDIAWHNPKEVINGQTHLEKFIRRRYGPNRATPLVQDAFNKLRQTVWDCQSGQASQSKSVVEKVPDLDMVNTGWLGTVFWYNKTVVVEAWDELARSAFVVNHGQIPQAYKFDLVDTTREVLLATVLPALHETLVAAYKAKDLPKLKAAGRQVVALIRDADTLLSSSKFFSFGKWVRDAKNSIDPTGRNHGHITFPVSGPTKAGYQHFLESNARNLITWWGPAGTNLPDYGSKQWGGLLSSYYLPRWELFIQELEQSAVTGTAWNREAYLAKNLAREAQWQAQIWGGRQGESTQETNGQESSEVVRELWNKWRLVAYKAAAGSKA